MIKYILCEWVVCAAARVWLSRAAVTLWAEACRTRLTQSERRLSFPEVPTPCPTFFYPMSLFDMAVFSSMMLAENSVFSLEKAVIEMFIFWI